MTKIAFVPAVHVFLLTWAICLNFLFMPDWQLFSYCRVVLDFLVLVDSLFCGEMYDVVGEVFHIGIIGVCQAGWTGRDEFTRRPHGLVVSVVDFSLSLT